MPLIDGKRKKRKVKLYFFASFALNRISSFAELACLSQVFFTTEELFVGKGIGFVPTENQFTAIRIRPAVIS